MKLVIRQKIDKKMLIFDGNHLAYRSHYVLPDLKDKQNRSVGCIYGVLNSLFSMKKKYSGYKVVFAWDERPTVRKKLFVKYKENRKDKPIWFEDFLWQLDRLKVILKNFDVDQYSAEGYEADDIAAKLVHRHRIIFNNYKNIKKEDWDCILITSDSDWKQLVDDSCNVRYMNPIKNEIMTDGEVNKQYNIDSPSQIALIKSIRGDKSDNIPKINRYPSKIASALAKSFKDLELLYEWLGTIDFDKETDLPKKWLKVLLDKKDQVILNYKLVKLGYLKPDKMKVVRGREDFNELRKIYKEHAFDNYLKDLNRTHFIRKENAKFHKEVSK